MSAKHPECPVTISKNCPDYMNGRVCALSRSDRRCFRKRSGGSRERIDVIGLGSAHVSPVSPPIRNIDGRRKMKGQYHCFVKYDG
ncbi:MAG: hypothetical protein JEZ11_24460 [Desulfobacterales bacterium]|nr:hypothetical protein [Desulfobacterales bacterium]